MNHNDINQHIMGVNEDAEFFTDYGNPGGGDARGNSRSYYPSEMFSPPTFSNQDLVSDPLYRQDLSRSENSSLRNTSANTSGHLAGDELPSEHQQEIHAENDNGNCRQLSSRRLQSQSNSRTELGVSLDQQDIQEMRESIQQEHLLRALYNEALQQVEMLSPDYLGDLEHEDLFAELIPELVSFGSWT
ncbi:hypothetical protein OTU49_000515 [Cherax quadricarinatus]|uniref:Uncharacterized protein n=1 Tax=Cherax quadricarinatus TaxID=27406 RepID=A0AAW0XKZ6_CHEQU